MSGNPKLLASVNKTVQMLRNGEFTELRFKATSCVVLSIDLFRKQQWAQARESTGNPDGDRRRFLEQFETIVGVLGSGVTSRGSEQSMIKLLTAMKNAGVPIEGYAVDQRYLEMLYPKREAVQALTPGAKPVKPEDGTGGHH